MTQVDHHRVDSAPKLLVVGINYAPEPTGSGPYTAGLAGMAAQLGYDVSVITGVPHYPSWRVSREFRWKLRTTSTKNGIPIRRLRHFVPRRQTSLRRALWEATFLVQALTSPLPSRPDLVVASTPGLSGAVFAAALSKRTGIPLGVVVQDVVGAGMKAGVLAGSNRLSNWIAGLERWALRSAKEIAVVSPRFIAPLQQYGLTASRIRVLPNWSRVRPARCSRAEARRLLGWPAEEFVVTHTGNMGMKQDLHTVVDAGRLAPVHAGLRFVIIGDGNQREAVVEYARGVKSVSFCQSVSEDIYPLILAASDLLLVSERPSTGEMSLPSKLTSYLSAGRPVVAAVDIEGACAIELAKTDGAGLVVEPGNPELLLNAVMDLRANQPGRQVMSERASAYAEAELGEGKACGRIEQFLSDLLHGRTPSSDPIPMQRRPLPVTVR